MMRGAGIMANALSLDYTEYQPKILRARPSAQYKGKNVEAVAQYFPFNPGSDPLVWYNNWVLGSASGSVTGGKFPELDANIQKLRGVTNFEERVAGIYDLNRWAVDNMGMIPGGPSTELVDLVWQGLRGPQIYTDWTPSDTTGLDLSTTTQVFPNFWFEEQI